MDDAFTKFKKVEEGVQNVIFPSTTFFPIKNQIFAEKKRKFSKGGGAQLPAPCEHHIHE